jgi:hypothetical protein
VGVVLGVKVRVIVLVNVRVVVGVLDLVVVNEAVEVALTVRVSV